MGLLSMKFNPIPTPAFPLKGREKYSGALKLALMRESGNPAKQTLRVADKTALLVRYAGIFSINWIPACARMTTPEFVEVI